MPNIDRIISAHNHKILSQNTDANNNNNNSCNCTTPSQCPMNSNCTVENIVYKATIYPANKPSERKIYIGTALGSWKIRFGNHKKSFSNDRYKNDTSLSKHYWKLKTNRRNPIVKWEILSRTKPPKSLNEKCQLCLSECLHILLCKKSDILNQRSELISYCRHKNDYKLPKITTSPNSTQT